MKHRACARPYPWLRGRTTRAQPTFRQRALAQAKGRAQSSHVRQVPLGRAAVAEGDVERPAGPDIPPPPEPPQLEAEFRNLLKWSDVEIHAQTMP